MSLLGLIDDGFCEVGGADVRDFVLRHHYSPRFPTAVVRAFADYRDGEIVAAVVFSVPASPMPCRGVCGRKYEKQVFELSRVCRKNSYCSPLSSLISYGLRSFGKDAIIISYADTDMGHLGYLYQATNWIYTGLTKGRTDVFVVGDKHARHYQKDEQTGARLMRSAKHRYVCFVGGRKFKRAANKDLRWERKAYPKGGACPYYGYGFVLKNKVVTAG